ncbi:MAG: hypothetical protein C4574_00555 [Candidatus Latescibacterota bacterium]|jgi:hypothetical protein|nr:MAG: hypothetical protein C4574_00555 [Candidatus Latescibacterota bacterium]
MPFNRRDYPANWDDLSREVKNDAGWRCEFCGAEHGKPHQFTGSPVVISTAHLDGDPSNCDRVNLAAVCQRCHLILDRSRHSRHRKENRELEELRRIAGYVARKLGVVPDQGIPEEVIERMRTLSVPPSRTPSAVEVLSRE